MDDKELLKLKLNRLPRESLTKINNSDFFKSETTFDYPFLTERNRNILIMYFVNKISTYEISSRIKLSTPRIRDIILEECRKIRAYLLVKAMDKSSEILIEDTTLSARVKHCLMYSGFMTKVKDLDGYPVQKLMDMRNMGKKCIEEIQDFLKFFNLSLSFPIEYGENLNKVFSKKPLPKHILSYFNKEDCLARTEDILQLIKRLQDILSDREKRNIDDQVS